MRDTSAAVAIERGDAVAVRVWARELVRQLSREERVLPAMLHPLGFVCFPVITGANGLCLHLWDTRESEMTPTVAHSHSWTLSSYVLCGTVHNDVVRVHDDAAGTHRVYEVVGAGDAGETVRPTSRLVRHSVERRQSYTAGDIYSLEAGKYHRSSCAGYTATIVRGRNSPRERDLVLGPRHGDVPTARRLACSQLEAMAHIRTLLRRVDGRAGTAVDPRTRSGSPATPPPP